MLLSYTNASFISLMSSAPCHSYSASSNFSPTLPLLSAIHLCFFVFFPPPPPHEKWGTWFCMSPVLLLRWVCVWAVIRLRFMTDRVCMARFASRGLSLSLLEVSWGQYHSFHFSSCCRNYPMRLIWERVLILGHSNVDNIFLLFLQWLNWKIYKWVWGIKTTWQQGVVVIHYYS